MFAFSVDIVCVHVMFVLFDALEQLLEFLLL